MRMAIVGSAALLALAPACTRNVPVVMSPLPPMRTAPIPIGQGVQPSDRFGSLFCGVLRHVPDADQWGFCARYFSPAGTPADVSAPIPRTHRILIVPGIFGQCVEDLARPFEDAVPHLRSAHGLELEYADVAALGSCEHNARQIADYLSRQPDGPPYIAFGYSKGASDLLEAIASHEIARTRIAAVVTIAGSVLGSRLAENTPRNLVSFLEGAGLGTCQVGDGGGIDSLRRAGRVRAIARFQPPAGLRTYSIAATSAMEATSQVLLSGWRALQAFSLEQDSQVIHEDAIVPGAAYLGIARGDHWAVALPFEHVPSTDRRARIVATSIDRNRYPRVALLEAALRYVLDDLR